MNKLKIHFLNTIWSDAILLEANNHFAMIDSASPFYYPMIKDHLEKHNVKNIDFIFLTHFHIDHYGNIKNIVSDFNVKKVYLKHYHGLDGTTSSGYVSNEEYILNEFKNFNDILNTCKDNNTDIIYMDDIKDKEFIINFEGILFDVFNYNNLLYELYSDKNSEFYNQKRFNENFNSAGLFTKINNFSIFFGGDITCSIAPIKEVYMLSYKMVEEIYKKYNISHIDIYKSCHHGGGGTNTLELCFLIKARYAIITNTARWLDNWPTSMNLKNAYNDVVILPTDHQKYIFEISDKISYDVLKEESLFITLGKN